MVAVILESGEPTRLYTALSLLVSTASNGETARGLVSFGALEAMVGELPDAGPLTLSLEELRDAAFSQCEIHVCSAALAVSEREAGPRVAGVISMPRFLQEVEGWQLVVV
jgi:peroxiredoxin family protein